MQDGADEDDRQKMEDQNQKDAYCQSKQGQKKGSLNEAGYVQHRFAKNTRDKIR